MSGRRPTSGATRTSMWGMMGALLHRQPALRRRPMRDFFVFRTSLPWWPVIAAAAVGTGTALRLLPRITPADFAMIWVFVVGLCTGSQHWQIRGAVRGPDESRTR